MFPRPFHRWKSFWLGVFILSILGWSWARSQHHLDGFLWMAPRFHLSAGHTTGFIELAWSAATGARGESFIWIHDAAATTGEPLFPKAVNGERYPDQIQLTVAYWFLMLIFLVSWSAFLCWWWCRQRRIAREDAVSLPEVS